MSSVLFPFRLSLPCRRYTIDAHNIYICIILIKKTIVLSTLGQNKFTGIFILQTKLKLISYLLNLQLQVLLMMCIFHDFFLKVRQLFRHSLVISSSILLV